MRIQQKKKSVNNLDGRAALFLIMLAMASAAWGQSYLSRDSVVNDPIIYGELGFYFPSITTKMRLDSEKGLGTEIGLEDDFNLTENLIVVKASGLIDLKGRSQILVGYTILRRSREFVLDGDVKIGDTTFYLGASAKLRFDVNYYAATWRYSFFDELNWNAGLSLGLRAVEFGVDLEAQLQQKSYSQGTSIMAPAILFGVHGSGYLTPRLLARYALEAFYVNMKGISINVIESNASVQYFVTKNIGIGGAYSTNLYRVEDIPLSENFDGKVLFSFGGFNLFLSARF